MKALVCACANAKSRLMTSKNQRKPGISTPDAKNTFKTSFVFNVSKERNNVCFIGKSIGQPDLTW